MFSKAQLKLYEQANRPVVSEDARVGANHDRHNRSFVRVPHGRYSIKFYPIKNWPAVTGITNQTFRTWIKRKVITAYLMHRMYVMSRAELEALASVIRKHRLAGLRHTEITDEMRTDCYNALTAVRLALDSLKRPDITLTAEQMKLLQPSIGERQ